MKKLLQSLAFVCLFLPSLWAQNQTPSNGPQQGSITASQCVTINVKGMGVAAIQITGTWTGTIQPALSVGGTQTYVNTQVYPSTSSTAQSTITANGGYQTVSVTGYTWLQVCGATVASGTANVYLEAMGLSGGNRGGGGSGTGTVTNPIGNLTAAEPIIGNGTTGVAASPSWLDATAAKYSAGASGDVCKMINLAIVDACSASPPIGSVKALFGSGIYACNTNMFAGNLGTCAVDLELGAAGASQTAAGVAFIASVPTYTPFVGFDIHSAKAASSGATNGTLFSLCGPGPWPSSIAVTWTGNTTKTCTFTDGFGNAQTVNQPSSAPITFNIAHGPYPAGTYYLAIGFHGQGITSDGANIQGAGWNRDGGSSNFANIAIGCGGNPINGDTPKGCFGGYDLSADENNKMRDFRITGFPSFSSTNSYSAGMFWDRTECCTTQAGLGWARPTIEHLNFAGPLGTSNPNSYGVVALGSNTTIVQLTAGSCAGPVKAWVLTVSSNNPTAIQVDPNNNGTSGCVNPTFQLYGAASSWPYVLGSLDTSVTLTPVIANGVVVGITPSGGDGLFFSSTSTGCPLITMADAAGGTGILIGSGFYIDGCGRVEIGPIHGIDSSGPMIDLGENNITPGGVIGPLDSSATGPAIQLGPGIDGNQRILSVWRNQGVLLQDNKHYPPITLNANQYPQGIPGYDPSGVFVPGAVGTFTDFFTTPVGATATISTPATTAIKIWGITIPAPIAINAIEYLTGTTADNTTDTFNFSICQGVSAQFCYPIVDTGAVAGTTAFSAVSTLINLPWVNAYGGWAVGDTIPAGRYWITMSCTAVAGTCNPTLTGTPASGLGSVYTWSCGNTSATAIQTGGLYSKSGFPVPIGTNAAVNSFVQCSMPTFILR